MTLSWILRKMHPNMEEIEKLDVDEDVTLVDMDTAVEMDVDIQGRMEEDVTTVKEINAAESKPTVFDDVEVTMTMAQTLIMIKAEKARILDEQLAKRMQDEEIDFKKLRAEVEVSGSHSIQAETSMVDLKEIVEEDVQNMLQIVPVAKFKVGALQVKYPLVD
nr:hypothetical protein [Tanacetum cinerariifolium]